MDMVAVVSVNNNTNNIINTNQQNNINCISGGGQIIGSILVNAEGGDNRLEVGGLLNATNNCLDVVAGVDALDLLPVVQQTTVNANTLLGSVAGGGIKSIVIGRPQQLQAVHALPTSAATTTILLNPVTTGGLVGNSSLTCTGRSVVATNTNNSSINISNSGCTNNNLMQLTGDQILTPITTTATTITTVKIEPAVLGQQQHPQTVAGHQTGIPQQQHAAMTNKRNRMEV